MYSRNFFKRRTARYTPAQIKIAGAIMDFCGPRSVFDLGCGIGGYLQGFSDRGCLIAGCDIGWNFANEFMPPEIRAVTFKGDCTQPIPHGATYDLVLCIEVAEHIGAEHSRQLCENAVSLCGGKIIFTAAGPGQPGTGHINCQPKEYWIERMETYGAHYAPDFTEVLKGVLAPVDTLGISKNLMGFTV